MRERVQMPAGGATEQLHQGRLTQRGDLTHGRQTLLAQLAASDPADAPQPLNREWMQERKLVLPTRSAAACR